MSSCQVASIKELLLEVSNDLLTNFNHFDFLIKNNPYSASYTYDDILDFAFE